MTDDLRALIFRMANELDSFNHPFPHPLATEARAALISEPQGDGPSYEELYDLADEYNGEPVASMQAALTRWGRPAPPPSPNDLSHLSEAEFQALCPQGYHGVGDDGPQGEELTDAPDIDDIISLAAIIREVDGNNRKGAAALAEAILSHPGSRWGNCPVSPDSSPALEQDQRSTPRPINYHS